VDQAHPAPGQITGQPLVETRWKVVSIARQAIDTLRTSQREERSLVAENQA